MAELRAELLARSLKHCNRCGNDKPLSGFYPDQTKPDGYQSPCRDCKNEMRRDRYHAQLERERLRSITYYQDQRERVTAKKAAIRQQAIAIYGGQCENCGATEPLEFDHVNGDGAAHRRIENAGQMTLRIVKLGRRITDWELRLLCNTCHRYADRPFSRYALRLAMTGNDWPTCVSVIDVTQRGQNPYERTASNKRANNRPTKRTRSGGGGGSARAAGWSNTPAKNDPPGMLVLFEREAAEIRTPSDKFERASRSSNKSRSETDKQYQRGA